MIDCIDGGGYKLKFHQLFKASLHEPKKLAAFRLLPIGKVFRYVFIFVALFTTLSFIRYLTGDAVLFEASPELVEHGETIGGLIYPMAFLLQLVISTFYIFLRISLFAYVGIIVVETDEKTWRVSSYVENFCYCNYRSQFLLTIGLDFLPALKDFQYSYYIHLFILAYIAAAAKYYPKITR